MRNGGLQHGDGALCLGGGGIQGRHVLADGLGGHVVLLGQPGALRLFAEHRVHRLLGGVPVGAGGLAVGFQLQGGGLEILQLLQPHADLQHTQLVPQDEVLLRLLRLLAQRLHLQLQLGDLVVDADQILLGALQLALRLLLAVAELGDARRLLKDLAALTGLDGQYLVDLALADDGIALPAHAGVHEQLVHVLQADGLSVDVVFALPAAVVAASHRHLRLVAGKDVLGVVDDQRHLGKAHGAALLGAAEDHVLHLGAPELAAVLLAHDPADGVGDVGLAGAVGAYDSGDVRAEVQYGFIGKALEALDFQCL